MPFFKSPLKLQASSIKNTCRPFEVINIPSEAWVKSGGLKRVLTFALISISLSFF
jgi:hypothetical protein